jgi:hypothetical protein
VEIGADAVCEPAAEMHDVVASVVTEPTPTERIVLAPQAPGPAETSALTDVPEAPEVPVPVQDEPGHGPFAERGLSEDEASSPDRSVNDGATDSDDEADIEIVDDLAFDDGVIEEPVEDVALLEEPPREDMVALEAPPAEDMAALEGQPAEDMAALEEPRAEDLTATLEEPPAEDMASLEEPPAEDMASLEEPPAPDDPFAVLLRVVDEVARAAGCGEETIVCVRALLGATRLDTNALAGATCEGLVAAGMLERAGGGLVRAPGFARQVAGWQGVLRGESEDFGACGAAMLDEWCANVIARAMGNPSRTEGFRRELRRRGVAAFGLVADAA